jgi:hypothetical protein
MIIKPLDQSENFYLTLGARVPIYNTPLTSVEIDTDSKGTFWIVIGQLQMKVARDIVESLATQCEFALREAEDNDHGPA